MDLLARAIMRARVTPYQTAKPPAPKPKPKIEPPNPTAAALVAIASMAPIEPPPAAPRPKPLFPLSVVDRILRACSLEFEIGVDAIKSQARKHRVLIPRNVAIYLTRKMTGRSMPWIGRQFGNRDHTTILNSLRQMEHRLECDPALRERVERIEAGLGNA